jgi:hypothetical protein
MNFTRIGNQILNLDQVAWVDLEQRGEDYSKPLPEGTSHRNRERCVAIYFPVQERGEYTGHAERLDFFGQEAEDLRAFFAYVLNASESRIEMAAKIYRADRGN